MNEKKKKQQKNLFENKKLKSSDNKILLRLTLS